MAINLNEITIWLSNWLKDNSNLEAEIIQQKLTTNYLDEHWIDSFKFIKFITEVEEYFDITFGNDEFQNRNFSTIAGLAEIINEKLLTSQINAK